MRYPAKWIFVATGVLLSIVLGTCILSPSVRFSLITGWEVRALIRFRERFKPEHFENTCPNYRLYQAGACVRDLIVEEGRLQYVSMTGRIYYLSTIVNATDMARENARSAQEQVETSLNLLEYLNDEMKIVLLKTGGEVDLSPLDSRTTGSGLIEDPEVPLRRRYFANLVDLWVKTWRHDEKILSQYHRIVDARTQSRIDVLRADRDELFSRFSFDLSRYERKRLPANTPTTAPTEETPSPTPRTVLRSPTATPPTVAPVDGNPKTVEATTTPTADPSLEVDPESSEPRTDESYRRPLRHISSEPDPVPAGNELPQE